MVEACRAVKEVAIEVKVEEALGCVIRHSQVTPHTNGERHTVQTIQTAIDVDTELQHIVLPIIKHVQAVHRTRDEPVTGHQPRLHLREGQRVQVERDGEVRRVRPTLTRREKGQGGRVLCCVARLGPSLLWCVGEGAA